MYAENDSKNESFRNKRHVFVRGSRRPTGATRGSPVRDQWRTLVCLRSGAISVGGMLLVFVVGIGSARGTLLAGVSLCSLRALSLSCLVVWFVFRRVFPVGMSLLSEGLLPFVSVGPICILLSKLAVV